MPPTSSTELGLSSSAKTASRPTTSPRGEASKRRMSSTPTASVASTAANTPAGSKNLPPPQSSGRTVGGSAAAAKLRDTVKKAAAVMACSARVGPPFDDHDPSLNNKPLAERRQSSARHGSGSMIMVVESSSGRRDSMESSARHGDVSDVYGACDLDCDEPEYDEDIGIDDNAAGGGGDEEDEEGSSGSGSGGGGLEERAEDAAKREATEVAFTQKLVKDEPVRQPPEVVVRPLLTNFVWLSVTPFPGRHHTIVFPPADAPWEGDPKATVSSAYVTPASLDPLPTAEGKRKRIGRKNKYGDLVYDLPEGSVRFSSVLATFGTAGFREADPDDERDMKRWSLRWTKRVEPEDYKALLPQQRVNHFPGTWALGRKDNLHRHLTKCMVRHGTSVYNFHPGAWLLPQDQGALERDMAAAAHAPAGMHRNVYIVKQVASACGRRMRLLCNGKVPKGKWIVQRYVHDPLLIYGYKFDLRLYVVVTSYLPLRVYVYEEGLVRFATTPYPTPKNGKGMKVNSVTAHLTNYSVNKKNSDAFVTPDDAGGTDDDERGSKWVLSTVRRYFEARGWDWKRLWGRIEDVIIKTLLAVETDVVRQLRSTFGPSPSGYKNCFELYGFDVLIRDNLDPVLMEVNIMPSLSTKCSLLDQRVKANMIADMLTLVGAYSMDKKPLLPKNKHNVKAAQLHPFLATLSTGELEAVCLAEEESLRRCHYKRLFPTELAHDTYKPLFQEVKPLNALLCEWEKAKVLQPPPWCAGCSSAGALPSSSGGAAVPSRPRTDAVASSAAAGPQSTQRRSSAAVVAGKRATQASSANKTAAVGGGRRRDTTISTSEDASSSADDDDDDGSDSSGD